LQITPKQIYSIHECVGGYIGLQMYSYGRLVLYAKLSKIRKTFGTHCIRNLSDQNPRKRTNRAFIFVCKLGEPTNFLFYYYLAHFCPNSPSWSSIVCHIWSNSKPLQGTFLSLAGWPPNLVWIFMLGRSICSRQNHSHPFFLVLFILYLIWFATTAEYSVEYILFIFFSSYFEDALRVHASTATV